MADIYKIQVQNGILDFALEQLDVPDCVLASRFNPKVSDKNIEIVCRMGDPDLVHCIVYKWRGKPGGIFSVHDRDGLLFCAVAADNLTYALAQGHFGSLVANARYGVDVYENMEIPDD